MISSITQFDEKTLQALTELCQACATIDGNKIAIYSELLANQRPKPASLLCYDIQKKILTGFAAAFFFEYNAAEISLLVHPDYRQQGLARILLKKLIIDIQKERAVDNLVFSLPHQTSNTSVTQKLKTKGFQYQSSEYEMIRQQDIPMPLALDKKEMRLANYGDIETLCLIDNLCFPEGQLTNQQRFENLLNRQDHQIYLIIHENNIIGKAHLTWDKDTAKLSDIAILPAMQGQGFGRNLIAFCINQALEIPRNRIMLSVETHNQHALRLYQHAGFQISNALDYWSGPLHVDF